MSASAINQLVEELTSEELWRHKALCRGINPNVFHPITSQRGRISKEVLEAKRICGICVVRQECLVFAIETNQKEGIWGGHTYLERLRIKRKRKM